MQTIFTHKNLINPPSSPLYSVFSALSRRYFFSKRKMSITQNERLERLKRLEPRQTAEKYAKTKADWKTQRSAVVAVVVEDITKSIKILFPAIKLPKVK